MQPKTKARLKVWLDELEKLDDCTKEEEVHSWIASVLNILGDDKDFQEYLVKLSKEMVIKALKLEEAKRQLEKKRKDKDRNRKRTWQDT